ncbi:phage head-tail joining protein [Bosea sp. (in: a-proteobacteria)]
MSDTPEQIAAEIGAIREAIATGARRVVTRTAGSTKEVEYPSFDDLKKRLDFLTGLQQAPAAGRNVRVSFARFSRGR